MPTDPMPLERVEEILRDLDEAWGDREMMEGLAGDHIRDLCTALMEAWKERDRSQKGVLAFISFNHNILSAAQRDAAEVRALAYKILKQLGDDPNADR